MVQYRIMIFFPKVFKIKIRVEFQEICTSSLNIDIDNPDLENIDPIDYFNNLGKFQEIGKRNRCTRIINQINTIEEKAFYTNFSSESVYIDNALDNFEIQRGSFANCYNLTNFIMKQNFSYELNNKYITSSENILKYTKNKYTGYNKGVFIFNNKINKIGDFAFAQIGRAHV